jgi:hypothetical protein
LLQVEAELPLVGPHLFTGFVDEPDVPGPFPEDGLEHAVATAEAEAKTTSAMARRAESDESIPDDDLHRSSGESTRFRL